MPENPEDLKVEGQSEVDRKSLEQQLNDALAERQKEQRLLQEVMNGAKNIHLVYLDRDFNFVMVNEEYAKTCGYKPEEMIGKNHFALYPDEENEAIFKRVRDSGIAEHFHDKSFVFHDQPERGVTYWDWTLKPVKNNRGEVEGLVFSLVETTERKEDEQIFRETRNYLENLLKYANAPIIVWNTEFEITLFNRAFEHMTGRRASEVLGKHLELLFPESEKEDAMAHIKSALSGEFWQSVEIPILNVDGTVRTALWNSANIYDANGKKIIATIAQGQDITQRKKAQNALVRSEVKYRKLFETSQDGIMARDLNGYMLDCNQAYAKMIGYSKKELRKIPAEQLLPEKWHEQRKRILKQVLETGSSAIFEREYKRKDGTIFPASVRSWRLTDEKGKIIGVWSVVRDITQPKELQGRLLLYATHLEQLVEERTKQLRDSERLAAIGATAGMVGHDIRNPLQAIIGDVYLAKMDLAVLPESEEKEGITESLESIENNIEYIDKIVQDLQDFAKPIKLSTKEINFENLSQGIVFKNSIPEEVTVFCRIEQEAKVFVSDPALLQRILSNLINNAVQAMPKGGKLEVCAFKDADDIVIAVQDTGVGIPEEVKPKLFTPLFTTKSKGQGFGLSVVKRFTEALGGTITFESEVGKGTKFILRLPTQKKTKTDGSK